MAFLMDSSRPGGTAPPGEADLLAGLRSHGIHRAAAHLQLRDLLVRATRRQVWHMRHQLPGAGPGELEDLAQQAANDAMVAVLRRLDSYEGRSKFSTWVFKFGILNAGVLVRRQAWRHREVQLLDSFEIVDPHPTPSGFVESSELAAALEHAILNDLTPHQRRVVVALLVDEIPVDVLAERLGSTRNALYKTLHDSRQKLRALLIERQHLEPPSKRSTP